MRCCEEDMAIAVQDSTIQALRASLLGDLITPSDAGYDTHRRVWNLNIDKRPALIARCTCAADVVNAVNFAREQRLVIAVRGGAHNVAGLGTCDEGIVLDLSPMKKIEVDPITLMARAEPGVKWTELDRETQAVGLATVGGTVGDTGIAGLTLGGGFGWLSNKYGMTVDNLLSVDIVTADGQLLRASVDENADLFWGVRGGSGNFGVVTAFEYRLHPEGPMIVGGGVFHPLSAGVEMLKFFREFIATAPDELTVYAGLMTNPQAGPLAAMAAAYAGPMDEGEKAIEPLKKFGTPVQNLLGPIPYLVQQTLFDEAMAPGRQHYWKADFLKDFSDNSIETAVDFYSRVPAPMSMVLFVPISGVASRVPVEATAFPHRNGVQLGMYGQWQHDAEAEPTKAWVRDFWRGIQPFARGAVYVNELDADEGEDRVRLAYGVNYDRLASIKAKYDPKNLFRLNANVRPARG
jgi:FAD/FMN-containing dehydrogenase